MTYRVRELRRAQADIREIAHWLAARSPQGARAWLDAYDDLLARLERNADSFSLADENEDFEFDVRQALFKTRHGRIYRALYLIEGDEVFVLRVRGPGQASVDPKDFV